jgi:enoyl-CoA hydratase/carnithine racemase
MHRSYGDSEDVLLEVGENVATITINRPEMRNALTEAVSTGLVAALEDAEGSDARCVVLTGSEGSFCAGGDVNAMSERLAGQAELYEAVRQIHEETSRALARVYECRLPTVAKIDGAAFGAGANLAMACDVQVASAEARISFGFRQVGLAVDTGTSYFLPRVVGLNKAKELVFTGELLDAQAAAELGLFCHVFEEAFEEQAAEFVARIAEGPTVALETSKRALNRAFEGSLEGAMSREAAHQAAVFDTADHREGAEAFMSGRDPEFEGH